MCLFIFRTKQLSSISDVELEEVFLIKQIDSGA